MFSQNIYQPTYQQRCILIVLLFLTIVGLKACKPPEVELPFDTIEQQSIAGYTMLFEDTQPALKIITSPEDVDSLDGLITVEAQRQLQEMDYNTHFAVITFLGQQSTSHGGVSIQRIVRQGNDISISAKAGRPMGDPVVTSPYHLVRVEKTGRWNATISFAFVIEGKTIATESKFVP